MASIEELKEYINDGIREQYLPASVTRNTIATSLDGVIEELRLRGIILVSNLGTLGTTDETNGNLALVPGAGLYQNVPTGPASGVSVIAAPGGRFWKRILAVESSILNQYAAKQAAKAWIETIKADAVVTEEVQSPYNIRLLMQGRVAGFIGYTALPESQGATVALGQLACNSLFGNNWTGDTAVGNEVLRYDSAGANSGFGNWAMKNNTTGYRGCGFGHSTLFANTIGSFHSAFGAFAQELTNGGGLGASFGYSAARSNKIGVEFTAIGNGALLHGTTGVYGVEMVSGGENYTTASVTISAPEPGSPGGLSIQATATAAIVNGAVSVAITNPGAGYGAGAVTITITGDGTGAQATPIMKTANFNTAVGSSCLSGLRFGTSGTAVGQLAGVGAGGNEMSIHDEAVLFLGCRASRHSSISNAITLQNAIAIGYNSKVSKSNTMALGGTGLDAVKVGIGTHAADTELHVIGKGRISWKTGIPSLQLDAGWNLGTTPGQAVPMGEIVFMPVAGQSYSNGAAIRGVMGHFSGGIDELNGLMFYTSGRTGYGGVSNFGDRDQMLLNGYGCLILAQGGTVSAWDGQSALLVRAKFTSNNFKVQSWQNYTGTEIASLLGTGKLSIASLLLSAFASPGAGTRSLSVDEQGNVVLGSGGGGGGTLTLDQVLTAGNVSALNLGLGVAAATTKLHIEESAGNTDAVRIGVTGGSGTGVVLYNRANAALFCKWGIASDGSFVFSSGNAALTMGSEGGHSYYGTNAASYILYFQPNRVTRMRISDNPGDYNVDISGSLRTSSLNLAATFTPSGSADTAGAVGDITRDDNYLYVKTGAGWKRTALESF